MTPDRQKIVITCAVTGAIHMPTKSDALPSPPEDFALQANDAAQNGAVVRYLHSPRLRSAYQLIAAKIAGVLGMALPAKRLAGTWLLAACATAFGADAYPSRPVTLINPYTAGSSTDLMARILASKFQQALGQPFVVTNRPGGSGVTGMTALVNATPDGLTLAYSPLTPLTIQPHILGSSRLGPNAVAPVCGIAENVLGIVVRSDSPYRSIADVITKARAGATPAYGSPGANSGPSLGSEDLARTQGVSFVHVPFQGDAPSMQELLAGRLDFSAVVVASAAPFLKTSSMRLLAVMSEQRHPDYPNVATFKQLGFNVRQLSYTGIFAPKGTSVAVVQTLDEICQKVLNSEELRSFADKNDQVLRYLSQSEFSRSLAEQYREQGESLRASGAVK